MQTKTHIPRKPRAHTGKRDNHENSVLKSLRKSRGLTLAQLAVLTGVSATMLSEIESGSSAKISVFKKIADFFSVSLDGIARNDLKKTIASMPLDENEYNTDGIIDIMQKNKQKTGKKGENFVVALEKDYLKGTPFANLVTDAPAHETGAHYDVRSFTKAGDYRKIEVKSTKYGCDTPFVITAAELNLLKECLANGSTYEIHRVYNLKDPSLTDRKIYLAEEFLEKFDMSPASYSCTLKEKYRNDGTAV